MVMTKRRTLMMLESQSPVGVHFRYDDGELPDSDQALCFTHDTWHQMGEPTQITLTIEPGDHLNEPS